MKLKTIAAVSLATCAGAALAQSSVTLYGVLDTNIEYVVNCTGERGVSWASCQPSGVEFGGTLRIALGVARRRRSQRRKQSPLCAGEWFRRR